MRSAATSALGLPTSFNLQGSSTVQTTHDEGHVRKCLMVCAPEKKLPIQVGNIDCIHVNNVYVAEPGQSQVFQ